MSTSWSCHFCHTLNPQYSYRCSQCQMLRSRPFSWIGFAIFLCIFTGMILWIVWTAHRPTKHSAPPPRSEATTPAASH